MLKYDSLCNRVTHTCTANAAAASHILKYKRTAFESGKSDSSLYGRVSIQQQQSHTMTMKMTNEQSSSIPTKSKIYWLRV